MSRASVISPYQKFWDAQGLIPLAGGSVSFLLSDGETPAPIYRDRAFQIPQINPYQLDASGRIRGDVRFNAPLTLKVYDSRGTLVSTMEEVTCFEDAAPFSIYDPSVIYGKGGLNLVTGEDGNYYLSLIDDNLGNDPLTNRVTWQQVRLSDFTAVEVARLESLGAILPQSQTLIVGDGIEWEGQSIPSLIPDYIGGLTTSVNATTPQTAIDIAAGECTDSSNSTLFEVSAITKKINEAWVVGTNNGGLASGVILSANTWYHLFVVRIGSITDVMFDSSVTCANGVANNGVTLYRRIASVLTNGSSGITKYFQRGNYFYWDIITSDVGLGGAFGDTPRLAAISTPLGINSIAQIACGIASISEYDVYFLITDPAQTASTPSASINTVEIKERPPASIEFWSKRSLLVGTDTSSQIRWQLTIGSDIAFVRIETIGWFDPR